VATHPLPRYFKIIYDDTFDFRLWQTQIGLPINKGRAGTMTRDYKRIGTTTPFAALNMLDGKIVGTCVPRREQHEFLSFLKMIDHQTLCGLDRHLVVDNYATHKTRPRL
jgi:hypothetical protein